MSAIKAGYIFVWVLFALCCAAELWLPAAVIFVIAVVPLGARAGWNDMGAKMQRDAVARQPFPAAAWYPDPTGQHQMRWWNGAAWTVDTVDPIDVDTVGR